MFVRLNRNKESVALDLQRKSGRHIFMALVRDSDVVLENLRPGTMIRLGLDYEDLQQVNPRLVYAQVSGFGTDGPYAGVPGLDIIAQGMSGLMSITGEPDCAPVKAGAPVCDLACALYATIGILAALRVRDQTGRGQKVEVNLLEAGVSLTPWEAASYFATGEVPGPHGSAHQANAPYQAIKARDGYFTVGASSDRMWIRFCQVLGRPEMAQDSRFTSNSDRLRNRQVLVIAIEQVTARHPRTYWIDRFRDAGIPSGPILTYDEVMEDPHLMHRGFVGSVPHPRLGGVQVLSSPIRLSETPTANWRAGPRLGEDTVTVLRRFAFEDQLITRLLADGVVAQAETS
jgi:crotonobetainyl-CoA:carnitine CoA-transferase CaiB-like acyl-CoA transferase